MPIDQDERSLLPPLTLPAPTVPQRPGAIRQPASVRQGKTEVNPGPRPSADSYLRPSERGSAVVRGLRARQERPGLVRCSGDLGQDVRDQGEEAEERGKPQCFYGGASTPP